MLLNEHVSGEPVPLNPWLPPESVAGQSVVVSPAHGGAASLAWPPWVEARPGWSATTRLPPIIPVPTEKDTMITETGSGLSYPMFATRDGGGFAADLAPLLPIARTSPATHLFLTGGAL